MTKNEAAQMVEAMLIGTNHAGFDGIRAVLRTKPIYAKDKNLREMLELRPSPIGEKKSPIGNKKFP